MTSFGRSLARESKLLFAAMKSDLTSAKMWVHDLFKRVATNHKRPRGMQPTLTHYSDLCSNSNYLYSSLHMSLFTPDRMVISSPTHCRDYFNEALRYHIFNGHNVTSYHTLPKYRGFDKNKLRIALFLDAKQNDGIEIDDGIRDGVRVANMYGRVAGWLPIRVVRGKHVIPSDEPEEREAWLLVGDANWMRTPQFISILLLLIRMSLQVKVPDYITDAYALHGHWDEIFMGNSGLYEYPTDYTSFFYRVYDYMLTMFANEREIFPHGIKRGFDVSIEGFHYSSGILSLVGRESTHPESTEKLKSLHTEVLKHEGQGN